MSECEYTTTTLVEDNVMWRKVMATIGRCVLCFIVASCALYSNVAWGYTVDENSNFTAYVISQAGGGASVAQQWLKDARDGLKTPCVTSLRVIGGILQHVESNLLDKPDSLKPPPTINFYAYDLRDNPVGKLAHLMMRGLVFRLYVNVCRLGYDPYFEFSPEVVEQTMANVLGNAYGKERLSGYIQSAVEVVRFYFYGVRLDRYIVDQAMRYIACRAALENSHLADYNPNFLQFIIGQGNKCLSHVKQAAGDMCDGRKTPGVTSLRVIGDLLQFTEQNLLKPPPMINFYAYDLRDNPVGKLARLIMQGLVLRLYAFARAQLMFNHFFEFTSEVVEQMMGDVLNNTCGKERLSGYIQSAVEVVRFYFYGARLDRYILNQVRNYKLLIGLESPSFIGLVLALRNTDILPPEDWLIEKLRKFEQHESPVSSQLPGIPNFLQASLSQNDDFSVPNCGGLDGYSHEGTLVPFTNQFDRESNVYRCCECIFLTQIPIKFPSDKMGCVFFPTNNFSTLPTSFEISIHILVERIEQTGAGLHSLLGKPYPESQRKDVAMIDATVFIRQFEVRGQHLTHKSGPNTGNVEMLLEVGRRISASRKEEPVYQSLYPELFRGPAAFEYARLESGSYDEKYAALAAQLAQSTSRCPRSQDAHVYTDAYGRLRLLLSPYLDAAKARANGLRFIYPTCFCDNAFFYTTDINEIHGSVPGLAPSQIRMGLALAISDYEYAKWPKIPSYETVASTSALLLNKSLSLITRYPRLMRSIMEKYRVRLADALSEIGVGPEIFSEIQKAEGFRFL
ncbi:MAG: hypothetical protein LBB34_04715 [Holosporales bacterium]|jgi:hypothetical protein|nr:hypothetical protein [Holosporales bacterium]